jgi:uncharacterized protein involved in exopolysaccharide biosynthesis
MQTKKNTKEQESLLQQFASKWLLYRGWFLLAFFIVAIAGAYVYQKFATPLYEAKGFILIQDETKGNEESKMAASLKLIFSNLIVENEIEVIQSCAGT